MNTFMFWLKLEHQQYSEFHELENWDKNCDGIMQIKSYVENYENKKGFKPNKIFINHTLFCLLERQIATKSYLSLNDRPYKTRDNIKLLAERLCLPEITPAPALNMVLDVGSLIEQPRSGIITHIAKDVDLQTGKPIKIYSVRFSDTVYPEGSLGVPTLLEGL